MTLFITLSGRQKLPNSGLKSWIVDISSSALVSLLVYNAFVYLKNVFLVRIIKIIFAMIAVVIWIHNCLFLRSLFTLYVLCSEKKNCWKRRESWKISSGPVRGVRMGKSRPLERAQIANQIQGFRIPDRSDAWENNDNKLVVTTG